MFYLPWFTALFLMFSLFNHVRFFKSKIRDLCVLEDIKEGSFGYHILSVVHLTRNYSFHASFKEWFTEEF